MRWETGDRSNIEDRRGRLAGRGALPMGLGGLLLLVALSWFTGTDFLSLLSSTGPGPESAATDGPVQASPQEERLVDFMDAVMADAQGTWAQLLGDRYARTVLVLFRDSVQSACGAAESATGPFYCPGDQKVYLDLSFFNELSSRFGAPGDFAQAYVIAHELGHHVQHLLGFNARAQRDRASGPNSASVALELQADCFAGLWGHAAAQHNRMRTGGVQLEPGDAEEALQAAGAIGDDRLQKMSSGRVMPDRFTHGTSAQRIQAFRTGMSSGDFRACTSLDLRTQ